MYEARSEAGSFAACNCEDTRPNKAVMASIRVENDMLFRSSKPRVNHSSTPLGRRSQSGRRDIGLVPIDDHKTSLKTHLRDLSRPFLFREQPSPGKMGPRG